MDRLFILAAAVVPALLVISYGVAKARGNWSSEPLWNAFLMGGVAAIGCLFVEFALSYLLESAALSPMGEAASKALFVVAIPEESAKFLMLLGVAEQHVDTRRKQDILLLALGVSLGFATLENLFYVGTTTDWYFVAAARAVTAVPGHGINGLVMGALLIAARLRPRRYRVILALLVPILLHAAYDFPLFVPKGGFQMWCLILWLAVLLLSAILAIYLCNRVLPAAVAADRTAGTDVPTRQTPQGVAVGMILIVAGPAIATAALLMKFGHYAWMGVIVAILPLALGIDLVWSGWRERRAS